MGEDYDTDGVVGAAMFGEFEEEVGVLGEAEGAGVEVDEVMGEAVAAAPGVVFGGFGELVDWSDVRDDSDAGFRDVKILTEEGDEVVRGGDDAVAGAQLAAFPAEVGFSDEVAEERQVGLDFAGDGEAGKML